MLQQPTNKYFVDDPARLDLVLSRFKHSELYLQSYHVRTKRWYDLFRGVYQSTLQNYRNNIHIPFIFTVIQSDVARKVLTSLGVYPPIQFTGYGASDSGNARRNETLVAAQMKDCDTFQKALDFYLCSDLYGTAISRVGWRTLQQREKRRFLNPITNTEEIEAQNVLRFDGPDWHNIDILDFFPQPGVKRINDMAWVVHRYWMDIDQMERMTLGDDNQHPYFIPIAVKEVRRTNAHPAARLTDRYGGFRNYNITEARMGEKFAMPVEIKEMVGLVPDEFAPDGFKLRIMAIANNSIIVKDDPFEYWHGSISGPLSGMFHAYSPMPDPHYFHGTGMAELSEKLQITANRLASQKLDALEVVMDPMYWVSEQLNVQGPVYTRAGKMIQVNGQIDDSMLRPFSPDMRGLEHAYPEIDTLWHHIQQVTGIAEDVVQGIQASSRSTAREFLGRQEGALTRISLAARLAEEAWLEPLANTFRALNRQYLKVPHMVKMLAGGALINPVTGLPLPAEPTVVDLNDINPDYRARAVGASQMLTKSSRQQNLLALLQAISANPVGMQIINWVAFYRDLFQTFDIANLDELFVTQVPAVNQMAQDQGQSPAGMIGGIGNSNSLPELLAHLGGGGEIAGMPSISGNQMGG